MILYFSLEAPHRWAIVDRRSRLVDEGTAESLGYVPARQRRITRRVAVVPGELVTMHTLRIPARGRAKAAAAVPYMLEESLASPVEDLEFCLMKWVRGGESKVAVVSRDAMDEWQRQLVELPGRVDGMVPEYLLLPQHTQGRCTVAADARGRLIVRSGEWDGMVIDEQELDLWWDDVDDPGMPVAVNDAEVARHLIKRGGVMVNEWRIGAQFAEWLHHGHQVSEDANLLHDSAEEDDVEAAGRWFKAAAVVLGLALLVRLGVDGYDYFALAAEDRRLDREIEATLTGAFPDITRVVNPRAQMEQRLDELRVRVHGDSGFLALLSVVAEALSAGDASLDEITFRDNTLLMTCRTSDFEALDRLQQRLARDGRVAVELVSSGSRDNSVSGRFRLDLGGGVASR